MRIITSCIAECFIGRQARLTWSAVENTGLGSYITEAQPDPPQQIQSTHPRIHTMPSIRSFFRSSASQDDCPIPAVESMHSVWKRIFEAVMRRGDTYKRDAFSHLYRESHHIDPEKYAELRVTHDA